MPTEPSQTNDGPGLTAHELSGLRKRARFGVAALAVRTVLVQFVVFGGRIALARLLDPGDFGIFVFVQFALAFFVFFGDAGLGAALIQKKEEPSREELSSVFFVQIVIASAIVAIVFGLAPWTLDVWPDLPRSTPWLLRVLSLGLLLTAARTVPSIVMERKLQFGRLGLLDVGLSISFYVVAVAMAFAGLGVWALIFGSLVQGIVGLALAFAAQPFRPGWTMRWQLLRPIFQFGIPYQMKNVVAFANSAVTPAYGTKVLGKTPVGFISWAQDTAYFPLKLVEVMSRVSFPLYSRLQGDRKLLADAFTRTMEVCAIGTFFFVALCFGIGRNLIHIVFTDKWMPAYPLLLVFSVAIAFGFFAPIVNTVLDATGRPKVFLRLTVLWTALNWIVVPIATARWGMMGFGVGYAVHVVVGNVVVLALVPKLIPESRMFRKLWAPAVAAVVVYLLGTHIAAAHATSGPSLVLAILLLFVAYAAAMFALDRKGVQGMIALIRDQRGGG
jgi:PST family polysaccharide transporter